MQEQLWQLSAGELQRRYREGSLSPVAAVQAVLARIDAVNPRLNAVVSRRDAQVLAEAQASAQRHAQGQPLSPLDGIPITVKDSLYLAGLPTTCGTPALVAHAPGHDELAAA
ncbi:MAG TPA: amidase family protein, partial [Variovorax sp.]|nr:amidase family protein [Variovorax sp.]